MNKYFFIAALALSACNSTKTEIATADAQKALSETTNTAKATPPKRAPNAMAPIVDNKLVWEGPVQWTDWDSAQKAAQESGKSTLLIVYSHTCPRCRELAAGFDDPELGELSKQVSMIKATEEEALPYREIIGKFSGYVPRLFIISPEGAVREDLVSPHPRYPYFYTVPMLKDLKDHLRKVAK